MDKLDEMITSSSPFCDGYVYGLLSKYESSFITKNLDILKLDFELYLGLCFSEYKTMK